MHESVEALKHATEQDRRAVHALTAQLERAKAEGIPILHEKEAQAKIAKLMQSVKDCELMVSEYADAVASGDTRGSAHTLIMIQYLQAGRQELINARAEITRLTREISHYQSASNDDDSPPDAS